MERLFNIIVFLVILCVAGTSFGEDRVSEQPQERAECEKEHWQACYDYGLTLDKAGKFDDASKYYQIACEHEAWDGCYALGIQRMKKERISEAMQLFAIACDHKVSHEVDPNYWTTTY